MPSLLHEVVIDMFRHRPLAPDLLTDALGIAVPEFQTVRVSPGDLTDVQPTEYRADAVVTLNVADAPVFAVVVEVQLSVDDQKAFTWPVYVATVYARLKCPAMLLVLCREASVATRCARPIVVSDPGLVLTPVVLGPQQVPVVTDVVVARKNPELTVLSAMSHGGRENTAVFAALFAALDNIDHEQARLYFDLLQRVLPEAARASLEEIMSAAAQKYHSDFARGYFSEGEAKGKAEGMAEGVLAILDARNVAVPGDVRAKIAACTDIDQLDAWIRCAATAEKIEDVLASCEPWTFANAPAIANVQDRGTSLQA